MDIQIGDVLMMKKTHPCGSKQWLVLRSGADLRLRCINCQREIMVARQRVEKNIRNILRPENLSTGINGSRE